VFPERVPKSCCRERRKIRLIGTACIRVTGKRTHSSRTVHNDETELGVRVEQLHQDSGLELVVTSVEGAEEKEEISLCLPEALKSGRQARPTC
jgi:hypothetical protein